MAKSVNQVRLIGNVGKDPEVKFTQSGLAIATFSVATSKSWKEKGSDDWKQTTQWHNIVAWRDLAEKCGKMLSKGKQVCVEGEVTYETYDNKDGVKMHATKIVASDVYVIEKFVAEGAGSSNSNSGGSASNSEPQGAPPSESQSSNPNDDLPF